MKKEEVNYVIDLLISSNMKILHISNFGDKHNEGYTISALKFQTDLYEWS